MATEFDDLSVTDYLHTVQGFIATRAAMGAAFRKSWGAEFSHEQVCEAWDDGGHRPFGRRISLDELRLTDHTDLSVLGFSRWDESGLRLIPLWAFNYIADGERLTSISGDTKVKGSDEIDLDVRGGCIAYGFMPVADQ